MMIRKTEWLLCTTWPVVLLIGLCTAPSIVPNHVSKEALYPPTDIWILNNDSLSTTGQADGITAYYQGVQLEPLSGPASWGLTSMHFSGISSNSWLEVNQSGELDWSGAVTWMIYIKPNSLSHYGVILDFYGTNGTDGVELLQQGNLLSLKIFDADGKLRGTYQAVNFALQKAKWNFVGFSYNNFENKVWIQNGISGVKSLFQIQTPDKGTVLINTVGNIRLGSSFEGYTGFNGSLSCMMSLKVSVMGKTLTDLAQFCDPNMWTEKSFLGNFRPYTPQISSNITTVAPTSLFPLITSSPGLTQEYHPREEILLRCLHFSLQMQDVTFASAADILGDYIVSSIQDCVSMCMQNTLCTSYITRTTGSLITCITGVSTGNLTSATGTHYFILI